MIKQNRIITTIEDNKQLAEKLKLSKTLISRALNFHVDSIAARKCRSYAVNYLGCHVFISKDSLI